MLPLMLGQTPAAYGASQDGGDGVDSEKIKKLQIEREIIERISSAIRMLAGSIAHELRTPLAIIGISVDLLMGAPSLAAVRGKDRENIDKHFKAIRHAIKLESCIIDNMLITLKKLSSESQAKRDFKKLSIAEDVGDLLESYPFLALERPLVKVRFAKIKDFCYWGDKILTRHVLFNLVKNALRAIKEAGKGGVEIALDDEDGVNVLKFTDTALGIPRGELPELFEPMMDDKQDRAGLGLSFCKTVMRLYGGDISCKSKLKEYTEFKLCFPKMVL